MNPRISVHIVAWNSMEFMPDLLRSLYDQTYDNFSTVIVDNASEDGITDYVRDEHPQAMTIRNARNLGFAGGHNQAMRYLLEHVPEEKHDETFILVTNPDIIFSPTYLEELVKEIKKYPEAASFGGKLLRAFGENIQDEALRETVQSELIDSTGLNAHKNRTFTERGAGKMDEGQYDEAEEIFGVSGALALYRASALTDVRQGEEIFDTDFFAYKEDIDLAWRMRIRGWGSRYVPKAVAYHYRGMYGKEEAGLIERIKNRRQKSRRRSYYSTRNHWSLLTKNEPFLNGLLASYRIIPHEVARFVYVCLFEPSNTKAFAEALFRTPRMWKKRRETFKNRKVTLKEMRGWFK